MLWIKLAIFKLFRHICSFLRFVIYCVDVTGIHYSVLMKKLSELEILQNQNKSFNDLRLLYPGVSGQKFKLFSKTDFSDGKSCFSNVLNIIESSRNFGCPYGFLLMVDCPECCRYVQLEFSHLLVQRICLLVQLEWCFQIILKTS